MDEAERDISDEIREAAREVTRKQSDAARAAKQPVVRRYRNVLLGTVSDGRSLFYDESACVFQLDNHLCELADVRALDACGAVRWRFLEHRDWMRRLDDQACTSAFERELERLGQVGGAAGLDEQIRQHVRKDDSYLHGYLVDTNQEEAVAEAVAKEIAQQREAAGEREAGKDSGAADAPALAAGGKTGASADIKRHGKAAARKRSDRKRGGTSPRGSQDGVDARGAQNLPASGDARKKRFPWSGKSRERTPDA